MIAENLAEIKEKISTSCKDAGRNPDEIKRIAVSKYFGIDSIKEASKSGQQIFGENKAQELNLKFEEIGNEVVWHFIGNLQKNKVKYVVKAAEVIHSVDSIDLAEEIDKRAAKLNKVQKILLEVNTSAEDSKSGLISDEDVFELAEYCKTKSNLELLGLMTMAPYTDDMDLIRQSFVRLRKLKEKLNKSGLNLTELSMGMTNDFEIAIQEGSTMLRIGSAIFGDRDYSKDWREI